MNKLIVKGKNVLANKKAEMYVDKAVWIIGGILVGGVAIAALSALMSDTVMTELDKAVQKFFTNADTHIPAAKS